MLINNRLFKYLIKIVYKFNKKFMFFIHNFIYHKILKSSLRNKKFLKKKIQLVQNKIIKKLNFFSIIS